mmetsp:Transcript_19070/g.41078  ORF Transcript_19070/g.41078 Transcript_19070/m.41078 type:complete len:380 (-) Transcript_19070:80-1219(-)
MQALTAELACESCVGYGRKLQELGTAMHSASPELCNDRETMLGVVRIQGTLLRLCSDPLRCDAELALAALEDFPTAAQHADPSLWSDRDFVLQAVQRFGGNLEYAAKEFGTDRDVVLAAVWRTGSALRFASLELREDEEVVLSALSNCAQALQFAGENLQASREVVVKALLKQGEELRGTSVLKFASPKLKMDEDLVLLAARFSTTPEVAHDSYMQGSESMRTSTPWFAFMQVVKSAIACPGEEGSPVLTVSISEVSVPNECSEGDAPGFICEGTMVSGTTVRVLILDHAEHQYDSEGDEEQEDGEFFHGGPATLNDLANAFRTEIAEATEVGKPDRVTLLIAPTDPEDGEQPHVATPWEWRSPLRDFCTGSATLGREV